MPPLPEEVLIKKARFDEEINRLNMKDSQFSEKQDVTMVKDRLEILKGNFTVTTLAQLKSAGKFI